MLHVLRSLLCNNQLKLLHQGQRSLWKPRISPQKPSFKHIKITCLHYKEQLVTTNNLPLYEKYNKPTNICCKQNARIVSR